MSTGFEQIKDASQLQEYLSKHLSQTGNSTSRHKNVSPVANDYIGRGTQRGSVVKRSPGLASSQNNIAAGNLLSDRYEKSKKKLAQQQEQPGEVEVNEPEENADEMRSIHTELDYTRKDASRHIIANNVSAK